jgi:hypothetical protein
MQSEELAQVIGEEKGELMFCLELRELDKTASDVSGLETF